MSIADGMRKMMALGIPMDEALAIVEAFEVPVTDSRKERNRRYYESHKASEKRLKTSEMLPPAKRLKTSENGLNSDVQPRAHVEDKLLFQEIEPQESKKVDSSPIEILMTVLDEETAKAVIQHRKAKKAPLGTALAARGLVKAFGEFPGGPQAAAEMMVTNGWTGFKRDYWDKGAARAGPHRQSSLAALTEQFRQELAEDGYRDESEKGSDPAPHARLPLLAGPDYGRGH